MLFKSKLLSASRKRPKDVELLLLGPVSKSSWEKCDDPKLAILRSIADALGMSVEQFYGGDPALKTSASEDDCLRRWRRIRTDEGRARALKALQAIGDEEAV